MERFITEGDEFYELAVRTIYGARRYVYLEMYIFQDDALGRRFARALGDRARAGATVIVVYDRIGCIGTPESFWQMMRAAGVRVYPYHSWARPGGSERTRASFSLPAYYLGFIRNLLRILRRGFIRRNHRKTLIVDDRVAFTGGFNIMRECSREYSGAERWLDAMYMTDRPVLVRALRSVFFDTLRRIRRARRETFAVVGVERIRKRTREAILFPVKAARRLPGQIPPVRPRRRRRPQDYARMSIPRALKKLMHHSQRRIWLTYPYFVPYGGVLRLLIRKALRTARSDVDVRIYLSAVSDLPWMRDLVYLMAQRLQKRGVRVFMYHGQEAPGLPPRFNHSKVALIDDWTGIGTSNLDSRSLILNLESLVLRHEPPFLGDVEKFFAELDRFAVPFENNEHIYRAGWRAYLIYPFRRWL